MKKMRLVASALLVSGFLVGCSQTTAPKTDATKASTTISKEAKQQAQATIIIVTDGKEDSQTVDIKEGSTVLEALQVNHTIEEKDGMVTVIDGVSQEPTKNTYWMYDLNGEMAPKGVKEQTLTDGDEVKFYLETFD